MTTESKPMCKARICRSQAWRSVECGRPAVTDAGFCRIHDPELKNERAKKRQPTKWEREAAAWKAMDKAIDEVRAMGNTELADRLHRLVWDVRFP